MHFHGSKNCSFSLFKRGHLKEKNLLPRGANSFLLEKTPFQKGSGVREAKQEVTNVVSLVQI